MHRRKTTHVQQIKDTVNATIAAPTSTKEGRVALADFLTTLLLETRNYRGFLYLGWAKEGGCGRWIEECKRTGNPNLSRGPFIGDTSRVEYY